ncbi:MAG: glycine cleavage system aminomethyltransferase GcvT [Nevskiales bacterium]|nr:glycine cleavage system aminomethyltransferase GcvT [Nevskiales bacterium]
MAGLKKTALHLEHQRLGARLVDFAGWDMPLHYGSQLEEHHAVRATAGLFDVAHMAVLDLRGARTREFLRGLLANDVAKLEPAGGRSATDGIFTGKALYSCMLNEQGGVVDDLIVYLPREEGYRLVVNAGTTGKDLAWIRRHAVPYGVDVQLRSDLGILAVQGPQVRQRVTPQLPDAIRDAVLALRPFQSLQASVAGEPWFVATTGYTGEDGFEFILPHAARVALWRALVAGGVQPCGLGARDTLRLEAGMNLYGQDMDESVTPLECGLAWTVAFDPVERQFTGRPALETMRAAPPRKQWGLVLEGRGVLRPHMRVRAANGAEGETTSGGFAPSLKTAIALARMPGHAHGGACEVEIRGQWLAARVAQPPFVRNRKVPV